MYNSIPVRKCQQAINEAAAEEWKPECDKKGNYLPKQCDEAQDLCWCVKKKTGKSPKKIKDKFRADEEFDCKKKSKCHLPFSL